MRRVGVVWLLAVLAAISVGGADEIRRRADAPQPKSPEESRKHFQLPDGLRIELVASEPLIAEPTAVVFDERGRMFVCELHGYNVDGDFDIQRLNETGKLDRDVRRIRASEEAKEFAEKKTFGRVKLLADADGDGRMDRADVWADDLPACYGLVPSRGGVIAVCAPDIVYLNDADGDGRAEIRETLFTGFRRELLERGINSPRRGADNWIYVSAGGGGGRITGPKLPEPVQIGDTDFRFKADGTAIEPVTGAGGTFGLALTDFDERFLITTSAHALYAVPLPHRYLVRNPYIAAPHTTANATNYNRVFPTSEPHPWRLERGRQEAWREFYGDREATPNGFFTSACGQMIYRADALPEEYHGNHFCCEPSQNLIHRSLIERDGLRFRVSRAPGEEESEFLTSTDQWFRPIDLAVGPDGWIYVVDMYREIIEDYSAIPRYLQQQFGLTEGKDHGRLWRIRSASGPTTSSPSLAEADSSQLVELLGHTNAWWRTTAQRLLIERGDRSVQTALRSAAQDAEQPQTRLHALYTLDGLGALTPEAVEQALGDPHFGVRMHGLRLAERWLGDRENLLEQVLQAAADEHPKVRLQAALTLGETADARAIDALVQLAADDGDDEWMRAAILSSVADRADRLLGAIVGLGEDAGYGRRLLHPLASIVGVRRNQKEIDRLLATVVALESGNRNEMQADSLRGLIEGLERGKAARVDSRGITGNIRKLLGSGSADVRRLAFAVAGSLRLTDSPEVRAAFDAAAREAADRSQPLESRRAALSLIAKAPYSLMAETAVKLLDPQEPIEIQLAAVEALAASDDARVGEVLLRGWSGYSPAVQNAALDAVFSRQNRMPVLLDAIEAGTVDAQSLDSYRRVQLLESGDAELRERAAALITGQTSKSRELMEQYRAALDEPRDVALGAAAYKKVCATCHRLKGEGHQVGPDLTAASNRPDDALLLEILEPNNQIVPTYRSYTVVDTSGKIFSGVLTSETATSITLRKEKGEEQTILRQDVEVIKASQQSLMPDNLEKTLTPSEVANLIAYLREALGPPQPNVAVLFDEDESFADLLSRGDGTATIEHGDAFSGDAALAITPLQRHSPRISDWNFEIVENPEPGQFRYMRFAWKARGGDGVMIELAADGHWPPSDSRLRRYYSGRNTTNWQAVEVADQPPGDWMVVTRDLYRDFGEFTLTGIAPTAMGGRAMFDRIELLRSLDDVAVPGENARPAGD